MTKPNPTKFHRIDSPGRFAGERGSFASKGRLGFFLTFLACLAFLVSVTSAEFPVADMDNHSLGIQYGLTFRGQNITEANVPSHEILHLVSLAYAPVPYVALEAGIGIDRFKVERKNQVGFQGEYGLSPAFGLSLYSPALLDILRVTAGNRSVFLNSEDGKGYRYSGLISNPFLGLIVAPSHYVDITAGIRGLLVDGKMRTPASKAGEEKPFANQDMVRGYLSVTLKSPAERAFMTLDLDASPSLDSDWSNGPREASVGIAFGAVLGWKARNTGSTDSSKYFPAVPEMKARQDKMAEEIE